MSALEDKDYAFIDMIIALAMEIKLLAVTVENASDDRKTLEPALDIEKKAILLHSQALSYRPRLEMIKILAGLDDGQQELLACIAEMAGQITQAANLAGLPDGLREIRGQARRNLDKGLKAKSLPVEGQALHKG
jgi:hypothetical protein